MITLLAVVALVLALLGLTAGTLALTTLGRLRRSVGLLGRGAGHNRESFVEASARHAEAAENTRAELDQLRTWVVGELGAMRTELTGLHESRPAALDHAGATDRAELAAYLDGVQARVDADFVAIRADLEQHRASLEAETQAERARLAADNSATRDQLRGAIEKVEKAIATSLRRVALVRYDAFDDLGGRLSFSLAVLDSRGDGVALTALAGRTETRVYAKAISAGRATSDLSPEEHQALAAALSG